MQKKIDYLLAHLFFCNQKKGWYNFKFFDLRHNDHLVDHNDRSKLKVNHKVIEFVWKTHQNDPRFDFLMFVLWTISELCTLTVLESKIHWYYLRFLSNNENVFCSLAPLEYIMNTWLLIPSSKSRPRGSFWWVFHTNLMTLRLTFNFDRSLWSTGWSSSRKSKNLKLYHLFLLIAQKKCASS